jgi:presenilin-like A22 family membrane protease
MQSDKPTETHNGDYFLAAFAAHVAGCLGIVGYWWALDKFRPEPAFGLAALLGSTFVVWLVAVLMLLWHCYRRESECRRKVIGALLIVLLTSPVPLGTFAWFAFLASAPY